MRRNYCLPVIKRTRSEVEQAIQSRLASYDWFEVWLDYVEGVDPDWVQDLARQHAGQLIVLFRREQLDPIHMPVQQRLALLHALDGLEVLVDLDVESQRDELSCILQERLKLGVIASYHNYKLTPLETELKQVAETLAAHHPAVVKVATYCRSEADAVRLLQLQQYLKPSHKHVVLGMGPHGVVTRVFGAVWGNEYTFAPDTAAEASAPGQLTRAQLEAIFSSLKV